MIPKELCIFLWLFYKLFICVYYNMATKDKIILSELKSVTNNESPTTAEDIVKISQEVINA